MHLTTTAQPIAESQNGLVWMAALELIESPAQTFAQAGPPAASCPEPCPAEF